jgi:hypothetical protein
MWLSLRYVVFNYEEYVGTEGQGGLFSGLDVPKYQCFLALPVAFLFMTLRFAARAVAALGGDLPLEVAPLDGLGVGDRGAAVRQKPSDVPTEVSGRDLRVPPPGRKLPPSEVPTEAALIDGESPVPQSKVPTDPHRTPGESRKPAAGVIRGVVADEREEEDR